jgi:hypothetical protein
VGAGTVVTVASGADVSAGAAVAGIDASVSNGDIIGAAGAVTAGAQETVNSTATSPRAGKKKRGFINSPIVTLSVSIRDALLSMTLREISYVATETTLFFTVLQFLIQCLYKNKIIIVVFV